MSLLEAARHRLDVEWSESLGVFEERLGHQLHGYTSLVAYLMGLARMGASRTHKYLSMTRKSST